MKDPLSFTKRLIIAAVIVVLVIIIGLLTMYHPRLKYQISSADALTESLKLEDEIFPDEVLWIIADSLPGYMIIDLRNPYDFASGHIETAVNIPVPDLLLPEHIDFYKELAEDSVQLILYGNDQLEANGPWLLLKQLGFNNMKVMLGGYDYYVDQPDMYDLPDIPEYLVEEPLYNFAEIIENASAASIDDESTITQETIIPVRKKKTTVIEGGC